MVFQKTDRLAEKNRRADKAEEIKDEETDNTLIIHIVEVKTHSDTRNI